ncbi:hypothetical protein C1701_11240 [Actinoalloteichus sp. AHMU CJ021]|uniref:hypothetical protein n=1 Tax=Actinoalloteichus sp. AHMU CJ021 TaxID=2072503 RepID=UPI0009DE78EC|nr:hypothetical protein C1701_11240 [Actinoalloteichus sp. AHMU CJ021]
MAGGSARGRAAERSGGGRAGLLASWRASIALGLVTGPALRAGRGAVESAVHAVGLVTGFRPVLRGTALRAGAVLRVAGGALVRAGGRRLRGSTTRAAGGLGWLRCSRRLLGRRTARALLAGGRARRPLVTRPGLGRRALGLLARGRVLPLRPGVRGGGALASRRTGGGRRTAQLAAQGGWRAGRPVGCTGRRAADGLAARGRTRRAAGRRRLTGAGGWPLSSRAGPWWMRAGAVRRLRRALRASSRPGRRLVSAGAVVRRTPLAGGVATRWIIHIMTCTTGVAFVTRSPGCGAALRRPGFPVTLRPVVMCVVHE